MYTGRRRTATTRNNESTAVHLVDGCMIATLYNGEAFVGQVSELIGEKAKATLYNGTLNGKWAPIISGNGDPIQKAFPISEIKERLIFKLNSTNKLPPTIKEFLKDHM